MSDVEQVSGENEIEIATGVSKTCITPVKQLQHHHHHIHQEQYTHHHHHHHQHQQQQQQQQKQQQYRQQNQQKLSSTLTIEEGTVDRADLIETRHSSSLASPGLGCFSKTLKVLFSTPGLVVLVVVYSMMGALIFPMLEAPQDIQKNVAIAKSREDCLKELWIITEKLNVLYERNWTMLVHEQLRRFEGSIVAATRNGGGGVRGFAVAGSANGFESDKGRWSFSEALLYSVTVITTIGHGNLTPKSSAGKIATILYALIGVPLMLMCLSSLGGLLAEALQCTYTRICCRLQRIHQQQQQQQRKNGSGVRRKSSDSTAFNSCHGQSHEIGCKSCKYDPVIGETSQQNSYKYGTTSEREDSYQLLHSTPTKVHHGSPCIQLKSSHPMPPPPNLKPYHHHLAMAQEPQPQEQMGSPQHHNYQMSPTRGAATTTSYHQQVLVPNNIVHGQHQHLVEQNSCTEITGTATIYFPIHRPTTTTPANHPSMPSAPGPADVHYNHQPLVKYHTIQLQHKKAIPPTTGPGAVTVSAGPTIFEQQLPGHMTVGTGMTTLTLPPPLPHYQTATVHGIRRAKFLAKPMPQEINTLLAESDILCRHDVSENASNNAVNHHRSESGNSVSTPGSVEIMEDEEENEQNQMGCPHGTPSRVPLIPSSPDGRKNHPNQDNNKTLDIRKASSACNSIARGPGQQKRVRLMAATTNTASSANSSSSSTKKPKGSHKNNCCLDSSCNLHTDHTDDEEDDDEDDDEDNYDNDDGDRPPQVPITIVLLILVAYICLGTVIFAFWENWSLIDGAYFCFVTLSTIGYADFMPQHTFRGPDVQLFACCAYLLLGLVLVAMSFSILETQLMWKCKRIAVRLKLTRD